MEIDKIYSLAPLQEGMLFHHLMSPDSNVFVSQFSIELSGDVDPELLARAFQALVDRHDALRTVFVHKDLKVPHQVVLKSRSFELPFRDLSGMDAHGRAEALNAAKEAMQEAFDLSRDMPMRGAFYRTGPDSWELIWTFHHIILDGWSVGIVVLDLFDLYASFKSGVNGIAPVQSPQPYFSWLASQDRAKVLDWWEDMLSGYTVPSSLNDGLQSSDSPFQKRVFEFALDASLTQSFMDTARKLHLTSSNLIQTTWGMLLQAWNRSSDVCFGAVHSGRPHQVPGIGNMVGLFINAIPVRIRAQAGESIAEMAARVQDMAQVSVANGFLPLAEIQGRTPLRQQLLDHVLVFENYPVDKQAINNSRERLGFEITEVEISESTNYDLAINIIPGDQLGFRFTYNASVYADQEIRRITSFFSHLIEQVALAPDTPLSEVNLVSPSEQQHQLEIGSHVRPYDSQVGIAEEFHRVAAVHSENVAIQENGKAIRYGELSDQVHRLAAYIEDSRKFEKGKPVGILAGRSSNSVIAMLAILQAGGAYVPLDPSLPQKRKDFILQDAGISILLTESEYLFELDGFEGELFAMDIQLEALEPVEGPAEFSSKSDDPAYVMYTSGTTGVPKGVIVPHKAVLRLVKNTNFIDIRTKDKILQTGSFSFDASTFEIWMSLLNGASLYLTDGKGLLDHQFLKQSLLENEISVIWLTSSWFNQLVDLDLEVFGSLRQLLVGGEALSPPHINKLRRAYPELVVTNGYGPTENTTFSTTFQVEREFHDRIPIGQPIANSQVYIMDAQGRLLPMGLKGEICVGGDGLAIGYLNDPELSRQKFVSHPFIPGERLYRTGDLGKWWDDGALDYLGRVDEQVKHRGFRIELKGIEQILQAHEQIDQVALVHGKHARGDSYLEAYFVSEADISSTALRAWLSEQVPGYMLPEKFFRVDRFPLNANGKTDKKALHEQGKEYVGPNEEGPEAMTEMGRKIAAVWQAQLGLNSVGPRDNYFVLGGDSIKAIRLLSTLNKTLGLSLRISDIFDHPTIHELVEFLGVGENKGDEGEKRKKIAGEMDLLKETLLGDPHASLLLPETLEDLYPMSRIQEGMIHHNLLGGQQGIYHDQIFHRIKDADFDFERFKQAFGLLVAKHEILRTSFHPEGFGSPVQIVHRKSRLDIVELDMANMPPAESQERISTWMADDLRQGFVLEEPGLWRMRVIRLPNDEISLLWSFHHAIIDGWSHATFMAELMQTYERLGSQPDYVPEKLAVSNKDYVIDQALQREDESQTAFWQGYLEGHVRTPLPFHKPEPRMQNRTRMRWLFQVPPALGNGLEDLGNKTQTPIKNIFLGGFAYLLRHLTGVQDLSIGYLTHGRPEMEDGDRLIGCFLNSVPLRLHLPGRLTGTQLLGLTLEATKAIKAHDKLALPDIVAATGAGSQGQNPFFGILFAYLDFFVMREEASSAETLGSEQEGHASTNTAFDFLVIREQDGWYVSMECPEGLFSEAEYQILQDSYLAILNRMREQANGALDSMQLIPPEELESLFFFNNASLSPSCLHILQTALPAFQGNARMYILDEQFQPLPRHVPGKLFIAGPEASQYAADTGLDALPDPYYDLFGDAHSDDQPPVMLSQKGMYRWMNEGEMEEMTTVVVKAEFPMAERREYSDGIAEKLIEIWQEILEVADVPRERNFFEMGGHSLLVTRCISAIWSAFQIKIDVQTFYQAPTIHKLAAVIRESDPIAFAQIPSLPERPYFDTSFAQKRLWIHERINTGTAENNIHFSTLLKGSLNVEALQKSLNFLVERHESLRTTFFALDDEPMQRVSPHADFQLDIPSREGHGYFSLDEAMVLAEKEAKTPFDLEKGPLLRISLFPISESEFLLSLTIHHIISDGWSMKVFVKELLEGYAAYAKGRAPDHIPPLAIQYRDFVAWQAEQLSSEAVQEHRQWWLKQLEGAESKTLLPTDYPRPETMRSEGRHYRFQLEGELLRSLKAIADAQRMTLFSVMVAGYCSLLHAVSGQSDLLIGTPSAGRNHPDLESQIGFYVNLLPLRAQVQSTDSFRQFLRKINATSVAAIRHQLYPFDRLMGDLKNERDVQRAMLLDVGFTWETGYRPTNTDHLGFVAEDVPQQFAFANWDLWLFGTELEDSIQMSFVYNEALFHRSRIELWAERLKHILTQVATQANVLVADLATAPVEADEENDEMVFDLNF